jgi:hypothetical protein
MSDRTRNAWAVSMDAPHATKPTVMTHVWLYDERGTHSPCESTEILLGDGWRPRLWIPSLDTWMLDTVRMVLCELASYVPYDPNAEAIIKAKWFVRRGRAAKTTRPPRLDEHVTLAVRARGWRAEIDTSRNDALVTNAQGQEVWAAWPTGDWSDPMVATLLDLTDRSPIPMAAIAEVLPGDPAVLDIIPPRCTVLRGIDPPAGMKRRRADAFLKTMEIIRQRLDDLLDGSEGEGGAR